jgi:hypothetical protein
MTKKTKDLEPSLPEGYAAVKRITARDAATLVEYTDGVGVVNRCYVPTDKITDDNTILIEELNFGIAYGLDFNRLTGIAVSRQEIAEILHAAGFWTKEDVLNNPSGVIRALTETLSRTIGEILNLAKGDL